MKSKAQDKLIQHRLLDLVLTPWTEQPAFMWGIINEHGAILRNRVSLVTKEEKAAYPSNFYALAWKFKKLLETAKTTSEIAKAILALHDLREKTKEDMVNPKSIDEAAKTIFSQTNIDLQSMLEENHDARPLIGTFELNGKPVAFEQPVMPIDEILGFPIYRNGEELFLTLEAKKTNSEDGAAAVAVPANNVGSGNIAGVSPGQEPPGPKGGFKALAKMKKKRIMQLRRDSKTLNVIAKEDKE